MLYLGRLLFAAIFITAGVLHFVRKDFFLKIMPPYLPWHLEIVYLSGVIEILLGCLLLFEPTRRLAAWGLIALLIAVFPANIHVFMNQHIIDAPAWVHFIRLPIQGLLVLWAWAYTGPGNAATR
jgi:uncharacterized membrane protein